MTASLSKLVPPAGVARAFNFDNPMDVQEWHAERVRSISVAEAKTKAQPFVWTDNHDLAFPEARNDCEPFGTRVLMQLRIPKRKTAGGLIIPIDTRQTDADITQIAMIRAIGPLAFCDRKTRRPWPEGLWAYPGDFVRCPLYGGDRWTVDVKVNGETEKVGFAIFDDLNLIGRWNGDPLAMVGFI